MGIESVEYAHIDVLPQTSDVDAPRDPSASVRTPVDADAGGPAFGPVANAVETALARALEAAAAAGRFDVVAQLARELEARRLARSSNVVSLDRSRRR
jgi:hypothetical protein